jgi:orotidine-5'-phosphate decarboxylase
MKLCVALDLPEFEQNISLAKELKSFDIWLKIGLRSYIRDGKRLVYSLKEINPNFKIFLDLKLYDIPNTMADASYEIAQLGIDMFNIHASSGVVAMKSVMQSISQIKKPPLVLAVTALTSFDNKTFKVIYDNDIESKAIQFAQDSFKSSLDGVVCSVYESLIIKKYTKSSFLTLTPGIRPFGEGSKDQKRVADINLARDNMVDFIVIGRPIYQSSDPRSTVMKIVEQL